MRHRRQQKQIAEGWIDRFKHDPIEDDPIMNLVVELGDEEARVELAPMEPVGFLSTFLFWKAKKRILKEKYQVDWKTPAEMNPGVDFD